MTYTSPKTKPTRQVPREPLDITSLHDSVPDLSVPRGRGRLLETIGFDGIDPGVKVHFGSLDPFCSLDYLVTNPEDRENEYGQVRSDEIGLYRERKRKVSASIIEKNERNPRNREILTAKSDFFSVAKKTFHAWKMRMMVMKMIEYHA